MESQFNKGDIIFVNWDNILQSPGYIVDLKFSNHGIPLILRVIACNNSNSLNKFRDTGDYNCLTKLDSNPAKDRVLYEKHLWLNKKHVLERIKGILPYIGNIFFY